jgi:hypothetical protein
MSDKIESSPQAYYSQRESDEDVKYDDKAHVSVGPGELDVLPVGEEAEVKEWVA